MPGPPPNPNARRTNNAGDWRTLPAVCEIPAPKWPLAGKPTAGQAALWRHLWTLPVALVWHEQHAERIVARYARLVLSAELGGTTAAEQGVVIRLEDGLLLTPDRRLKARMLIAEPPAAEVTQADGNVTLLDDYRDVGVG